MKIFCLVAAGGVVAVTAYAAAPEIPALDLPEAANGTFQVMPADGWCNQYNVAAAGIVSSVVPKDASDTTGVVVDVTAVSATGALQVALNPSDTTAPTGTVTSGSAWRAASQLPFQLYVRPKLSTSTPNVIYIKNNNSYTATLQVCTKHAY
jgi:opacity protein-like surface antigen